MIQKPQKAKRRVSKGLTAWVASEDISSAFIVKEEDDGIGDSTEPPTKPKVRHRDLAYRPSHGDLQLSLFLSINCGLKSKRKYSKYCQLFFLAKYLCLID